MKTTLTSLLLTLFCLAGFAQESNLVFFSQDGQKFQIFLNGVAQNEGFSTNVKVTGLNQPYYSARVVFENKANGEIDKNIQFNPNTETVFAVKLGKKGYVLRWQSEVPLAQAAPPAPDQTTIIYHVEPLPQTSTSAPSESISFGAEGSVTEVSVETTQTVQTEEPENVGINIDLPEIKMNVSMKVNEGMGRVRSSSSTTSTTTTTSSSSMSGGGSYTESSTAQPAQSAPSRYNMPGYSGPYGCDWPASSSEFNSVKSSIESKTFRDDKLTVTKQILRSKCFTTDQVKEMIGLFTFEDDKVEVAKMAYPKTFDQGNYYKINDAFTYSSSIDELNEFLDGQ